MSDDDQKRNRRATAIGAFYAVMMTCVSISLAGVYIMMEIERSGLDDPKPDGSLPLIPTFVYGTLCFVALVGALAKLRSAQGRNWSRVAALMIVPGNVFITHTFTMLTIEKGLFVILPLFAWVVALANVAAIVASFKFADGIWPPATPR